MICGKCGADIPFDSRFCPECGTQISRGENNCQNGNEIICVSCGKKIPADSRFCPECSAKQENQKFIAHNSNGANHPNTIKEISLEEQEKIKKRNKIVLAIISGVLGLCVILSIIFSFVKPTINLNKYLSVSFEGYDTVGKAVIKFDAEEFESDYADRLGGKKNALSGLTNKVKSKELGDGIWEMYDTNTATGEFLSNCVKGDLDKKDGLKNGDVVTYKWDCDDEYALEKYGFKLKYENTEYTVEGLKEAETFDPFAGVEVVFEGIAPNGSASITGEPKDSAASGFGYEIDKRDGLSNGESVTVTAKLYYGEDPVEYCIENYGKIPSPLSKEYKVEGLSSYVRSIKDVSDESLIEMQDQAKDVYNAEVARNWGEDEILDSFTYIGNYLLTTKNSDGYYGKDNLLTLVYKIGVHDKYSNDDGDSYDEVNTFFWYIQYNNLMFDDSGKTNVDVTNYNVPHNRIEVDSGVSSGWWSTKKWYYTGYFTLDDLYKEVVIGNSESYKHEDNIDESVAPDVVSDHSNENGLFDDDNSESGKEEDSEHEGMIFPKSSEEIIDKDEIENLSDEDLRYAINELYARHGYIFKDEGLREYYNQFDWYEESIPSDEFVTGYFNDVENKNVKNMQAERDRRK